MAVEASVSQVVGSFPAASPVYIQVHQAQIIADPECVERVQQRNGSFPSFKSRNSLWKVSWRSLRNVLLSRLCSKVLAFLLLLLMQHLLL